MKSKTMKKALICVVLVVALFALLAISTYACTTIYVGGNLTEDGVPIVARSEDYTNSASKLMYISPSGEYKAGETYYGCPAYGEFEWTWSHDSYRFTGFTADILFNGTCPECGKAGHPSYTESGANEKGVTVSATETLNGTSTVRNVDPYCRTKKDGKVGIEETDLPTVILSEAATAREGVELLLKIYDEYGCYGGSGLFIADKNEVWYVENCTGTQYIALKLNNDLMFLEPNLPVIGLIDLDDTENVIASSRLIEVAKTAGTFVGNEEENQIDFRASYASNSANARLVNGLNFVNAENSYVSKDLTDDNSIFTISNVKDGKTVALYTNIQPDRLFTPDDIANYYKLSDIANTGNTDTAFFQLYPDRPLELATVEWTSMSHGAWNVFIPSYPLLLDGLYEGYGAPVGEASKNATVIPDGRIAYRTSTRNNRWTVLPENWDTNFYWTFDALSNYILYSGNDGDPVTDAEKQYVLDQFAALQQEIYDEFDVLNTRLDNMLKPTSKAARTAVTEYYAKMSEKTHKLALELVNYLVNGFTDVDVSNFCAKGVAWAAKNGITTGATATEFWPAETCTRGQIVTFLWRAAGCPAPAAAAPFADVKANDYFADAVAWAAENGITNGTGKNLFEPNASCTRAQIVTFLWRANGKAGVAAPAAFEDVAADAYYADAVAWAAENGITTGVSDGIFAPDKFCTRGESVTFLYRCPAEAEE